MTATGTLLSTIFTVGWVPMFVWRTEDQAQAFDLVSAGERFWRGMTLVVVSLQVTAACTTTAFVEVPRWRAVAGLALFVVGLGAWLRARLQIGPLRQRRPPTEPPAQLRCDGMFGLVRHPLYLSYLIIIGAPVLTGARTYLLLGWCACVVVLGGLAIQEERRLRAQLGDAYAAYCERVPRLIPFLW